MHVRRLLVICLIFASVSCGRAVGIDPDAGDTLDAAATGDAAIQADGGTPVLPAELLGAWLDSQIGNCIDYETWLHFSETGVVTFISGDFDACMDPTDHCRVDRQGQFQMEPGGVLRFEWSGPNGPVVSRRSSSVVDLAEPGAPEPELHLSLATFWRSQTHWRWTATRESDLVLNRGTSESYLARITTFTEIGLGRDPRGLAPGELARLDVRLVYTVEPLDSGPAFSGDESFELDGALDVALGSPGWPMLTALLDGQEAHYQWWALLEARGLFDDMPTEARQRIGESFSGFLLVEEADAERIIPYPGYAFGAWFWRAESFDPRPAPACGEPAPFGWGLP